AQARAEEIVLQGSDLPDDWIAQAEEQTAEGERSEREFNRCVGTDFSGITIIGEAESGGHETADGSISVNSESTVFESAEQGEQALAEVAEVSTDRVDECMTTLLDSLVEEGFELGDLEVSSLDVPTPAGADQVHAWRAQVEVSGEGGRAMTYFDLVLVRGGDAGISFTTFSVVGPFEEALRDELLAAMAARLGADSIAPSP
ncbi:MAG: hypothetical protein ACRDMW_06620, partial [Gaiellaceae bacterium]